MFFFEVIMVTPEILTHNRMTPSDANGEQDLGIKAITGGAGADQMRTSLNAAVESCLRAKTLSRGTRNEYSSTLRKWEQ